MTRGQRCIVMSDAEEHAAMVPPTICGALRAYVVDGRLPGQFLQAVLRNDLMDAVCRANAMNLAFLDGIVKYVYNRLPGTCWGSPEKVAAWVRACEAERIAEAGHREEVDSDDHH
jgi:hypothetical protein